MTMLVRNNEVCRRGDYVLCPEFRLLISRTRWVWVFGDDVNETLLEFKGKEHPRISGTSTNITNFSNFNTLLSTLTVRRKIRDTRESLRKWPR